MLKLDPHNADLLSRAFLSVLTDGDIDEAGKLADRLLAIDHNDRIARLVVGIRELKQKHYGQARRRFPQSVRGPVTDLTATLLSAWALAGEGDAHAAVDAMDKLSGPDWYGIFKDLHAGLILDLDKEKEAGKRYASAYKADPTALRTVEAYGRWLSRNASKDDALKVYAGFRQGAAQPSADHRGDQSRFPTARNCRRWSIRRRPAPPRRFTGSAPRSAAAAARISR